MSNVPRELLEEAFVKPIRFALILDDQFPTYATAGSTESSAWKDYPRAVGLFEFCRRNGWLCDIDNGIQVAERFEDTKHLHQSDLLVLDYHLDPAKANDPTRALGILQKLANSPHFNLVVIYTSADPEPVSRDVAYALGAGPQVDSNSLLYWESEGEPNDFSEDLSTSLLDAHLSNHALPEEAKRIRDRLGDEFNIGKAFQEKHLRALLDIELSKGLSKSICDGRPRDAALKVSFSATHGVPWVTAGNVFVAVVNKLENPDVLVDRLLDALGCWNPEPLRVLMTHARSTLEKTGSMAESRALGDARKQSGLLLYLLLAKSEAEKERRLVELYSRLSSDLARTVDGPIVAFGKKLLASSNGANQLAFARAGSRLSKSTPDGAIYHALNEYLSTDKPADGHVTTGFVFACNTSKGRKYWLCTSPACDLVPGEERRKGLAKEIAPARPATAARLNRITSQSSVFDRLKQAERGRHIFVTEGAEMIALEVTDDDSRQMELEVIFLEDDGAVRDGVFKGSMLTKTQSGSLALEIRDFQVVAALRTEYAGRLLTLAGNQAGRIGVDYLDLPKENAAAAQVHPEKNY